MLRWALDSKRSRPKKLSNLRFIKILRFNLTYLGLKRMKTGPASVG